MPRPKWYSSDARGRAPRAKYAREGSNAPSKGRSRNEMTRSGSLRLDSRRAIAKWKLVVKLTRRREMECGSILLGVSLVEGVVELYEEYGV